MATLVLTAVGAAVGGPIGAMLGAAAGQAVDRRLFSSGARRSGPRLTDLAVQTSTYGAAIPRVWGRARVAGIVIWSTDLVETRESSGGGKGQPGTTTYSYSASFAVALSTRPIRRVARIWADGKLLRGAAGDWKSATGFRLHTGDEAQAPDPLIASAVTAAPAHRGIAYAVFEDLQLADFGNRIPSLTFEVVADEAPPGVGAIARELGGGVIAGAGPAGVVEGFAAGGGSVAGALEMLAVAADGWFAPAADGRLALRDRDAAAASHVLDADAHVARLRQPAETVPARLSIQHYDPARDYQVGTQQARGAGDGGGNGGGDAIELPVVIGAARAKGIAEAALLRRERGRETIELRLDATRLGIVPGDAVTLPGVAALPGVWRVRRAMLEGWEMVLSLEAAGGATVTRAADGGAAATARDVPAGRTLLHAFELPPLDETLLAAPRLAVAAAGTAPGWRRAPLLLSDDGGVTWRSGGATARPAMLGGLATALPRASALLVDRRHAVEVMLAHDAMTLASVDEAALDRGANLALIGDELVQFRDAVQIAPRRWRIATLLRARRGTAAATHAAGSRFVLIERDALAWQDVGEGRDTVAVLAAGVGDGAGEVRVDVSLTGASVAPPGPVALRVVREGDARVLAWRRRSRAGWRWRDDADVPLAEEREQYRVRAATSSGERVAIVAEPRWAIPAALLGQGALTIGVRQIGTHASSPEASITIA